MENEASLTLFQIIALPSLASLLILAALSISGRETKKDSRHGEEEEEDEEEVSE